MRSFVAALIVFALELMPLPAAGDAPSRPRLAITGYVESDTAYRLKSPYSFQKSQNRLELELDVRIADSLRLRTVGRTLYDPVHKLVPDDPHFGQRPIDRAYVSEADDLEFELRELYLDWTGAVGGARVDLRLGKQQIVWGQAFRMRVLDVVNAIDLREFVLDDWVDARIPVFGGRLDVWLEGWEFQFLVLPDFEPDRLPDPSTEFAIDPDLRGALPSFASPGPFVSQFTDQPFVVLEDPIEHHDWELKNTAFGLKIGRVWKGFDLALHYLDARDPSVAFRRRVERRRIRLIVPDTDPPRQVFINPQVNFLTPDHVRVHTVGASFATSRGDFTFWGEGALTFDRALAVDDLEDEDGDGIVQRPDLQYVLAADWTGWSRLFLNVQAIQSVILNYDDRIELDRFSAILSLLLRFNFLREKLFPQLFVFFGVNEVDAWIEPSIVWRVEDWLSLMAGADFFLGSRKGIFGQYAHRREEVRSPENLTLADDALMPNPPPGRTSRAFFVVRFYFGTEF